MRLSLALVFILLLCAACGDGSAEGGALGSGGANGKPVVLTTFYPTTYFTTRIAGDLAEVRCPLPADADPVSWKPSEEVLADYQAADLVVANGAKFEKWVGQVSLPRSTTVKTAEGFRKQWVRFEETTHSHGPEGEHSHMGTDGHTWLDPQLAILQSRAIADALIKLRPQHTAAFEAGFAALEKDLAGLHAQFESLGRLREGESLYASHPTYAYLRQRYGWRVVDLALDPDAVPSEEAMTELQQKLQGSPGRFLLWEREPDAKVVEALRKAGLGSLVFDPCERAPAPGGLDYLEQMRAALRRLSAAFDSDR